MKFKDIIWLFKNLKYSKISFKIYLKNNNNITIGKRK